ncbi:MAG: hypothetical protein KDA80_24855 [Planctomycetaceae bacterium]|nr:hypothetical protein [Planctomycetaceae bacterium]
MMTKILTATAILASVTLFNSPNVVVPLPDTEADKLVGATYGSFYTCGSTPTTCPGCTAHTCALAGGIWTARYCTEDGSDGCSITWAAKFTCVWNGLFDWTICDDTFGNNVCGNQRVPLACGAPFRNPTTFAWACPASPGCGGGGGAVAPCNGCV